MAYMALKPLLENKNKGKESLESPCFTSSLYCRDLHNRLNDFDLK